MIFTGSRLNKSTQLTFNIFMVSVKFYFNNLFSRRNGIEPLQHLLLLSFDLHEALTGTRCRTTIILHSVFKLPAITAIEKIPPFLWHSVGFTHSIVIIFQSYIFQFKLLFKKKHR